MRAERGILALIVLAYFVLGLYYAVTVPVFEAPDEMEHFFYARHLADTLSLPVQNPEAPALWGATGIQPPLYYVLIAGIIAAVDTHGALDYLWRNPYVNLENPLFPGNKNFFVHTEREAWPYRDLPLAVHLARGVSLLLGAAALLVVYSVARALFPLSHTLPLLATATVAFIPEYVFVTSTLSSDALLVLAGALVVWGTVRLLGTGKGYADIALLGGIIGLAALSKISGLLFLLPGIVAVWIAAKGERKRIVVGEFILLGTFLLVTGWWYVRNILLYGDPLGISILLPSARFAPPPLTLDALAREARWLVQSFWALFGWYNVPIGPRAYILLNVVLAVIVTGGILGLVRRQAANERAVLLLLTLTAGTMVVYAIAVRSAGFVPVAQGRHLFPALAAIAPFFVLGWTRIVPSRLRPFWGPILPVGLLTLAIVVPGRWIAPAYARPARLALEQIPVSARRVDMVFDGRIRVWAVDIPQITAHVGDTIDVTLYMSKVGELPVDYTLYIRLLGREREEVGRLESLTGWGTYPTRLWQEGDIIADHYRVRVSENARVPTLLRVEIGFLNHWTGRVLPLTTSDGTPISGLVKTLRLVASEQVIPQPQVPVYASFGDEIALVGIDPPPPRVARGEEFRFRLYWQALRPARASYTIFTHLVREGDPHPIAQHDKLPLDGDYPTIAWAPGEIVVDTYRIRVPENAAPGTYALVTGVYQLQTLQRLPLAEGPTRPWLADAALVTTLEVR